MKELTKEQKLNAYTYAYLMVLAFGDDPNKVFVCNNLGDYVNNLTGECNYDLEDFPEFRKFRPRGSEEAWWDNDETGNLSRLRAIERAIELIEKM